MPFGLLVNIQSFEPERQSSSEISYVLLSALWAGLFFTVSGGLLRILFWLGRKEFRYNFAKGCAFFSRLGQNNHKKLEYLMLSVNSYNKFLQRTIGVRLNELIQSKIARAAISDPEKIKEISKFFDSSDRLSPASQMSKSNDLNLVNDEVFVKAKTNN